jgi:hypothetical protein
MEQEVLAMGSIILPEARANYVFLTKPRKNKLRPEAEPAYSVVLAFDRQEIDDTEGFKELKDAMLALAREKAGDNALKLLKTGRIANPIRDGGEMVDKDGDPMADFEDCYVITARRRADLGPPGLVDARVRPIIDPTEIYSGMRCIASVNPFWYEVEGKRGIGIGLNNVQKVADGERIGGKPDPKSEFQALKGGKNKKREEEDDDIPF